jgi:TonB family protein
MFEFAISQNRSRGITKRFLACILMSFLFHLGGLLVLIEYPELLTPGLKYWIKLPTPFAKLLTPKTGSDEEKAWRTVAMIGNTSKMRTPSNATLKKYMFDRSKKESASGSFPIRIRLNQEALAAAMNAEKPKPALQHVTGTQEPKPVSASPPSDPSVSKSTSGRSESANEVGHAEPSGPGKSGLPFASGSQGDKPAQAPAKKTGNAPADMNSSSLAEAAKSNAEPKASTPLPGREIKTFADQKAAIIQEGSGLFDTKGFPLKEYADLIIERIKGNWYIPTTLQRSKGRTTVIFYIDKDGRYTNVKIVGSSGIESFDITALNAIINSNPFPPLPRGFPGDHIGAKFVFSYNEAQ